MSGAEANDMQARNAAHELARSMLDEVKDRESFVERIRGEVDQRIKAEVASAVSNIKLWVLGGIVVNLLPMILLAYQIGQFTNTVGSAVDAVKSQSTTLDKHEVWMGERERWEQAVESWAVPQGFQPPRIRPETR